MEEVCIQSQINPLFGQGGGKHVLGGTAVIGVAENLDGIPHLHPHVETERITEYSVAVGWALSEIELQVVVEEAAIQADIEVGVGTVDEMDVGSSVPCVADVDRLAEGYNTMEHLVVEHYVGEQSLMVGLGQIECVDSDRPKSVFIHVPLEFKVVVGSVLQ